MKIAIVAPSPVPFDPGGAEAVWTGLYRELSDRSLHDVELIKIPVRERTLSEVMSAYEAFTRLDLDHFDLVISGKYPGWMVSHPQHVLYLLHPLRGLYDSYGAFHLPLVDTSPEPAVHRLVATAAALRSPGELPGFFDVWRSCLAELGPDHPSLGHPSPVGRLLVRAMDSMAMRPGAIARHFAISRTVADRPDYFPPGVHAQVLYPPSDLQGLREAPGEFFFTTSRHDGPKRLDLVIRAMEHYTGTRELLIGGRGPESARLEALAAGDPRIRFVGRLSPEDLVDHYARAIGVPFIPFDEDLGLVTIEAMTAGKPVLTSYDAGGPTEFVINGRNGFIVEPTPEALGKGLHLLEELSNAPSTAAAAERAVRDISWTKVATDLVGARTRRDLRSAPATRSGRPRLVVTSTFPVWPPRGGGQLRMYHLYGALSKRFDIDLICLATPFTPTTVKEVMPGMTEYVVARSGYHHAQELVLSSGVAMPVTDMVAGRLVPGTPEYMLLLEQSLKGASGVLLADPFLNPAVELLGTDLPVIYDAFNCEYVLKSQMLPLNAAGDAMRAEVLEVEGNACRDADLVMTVSDQDRQSLRDLYGTDEEKFLLVPNGADLDAVDFTPMNERRHNRERWLASLQRNGRGRGIKALATFVGSWHPPNNAAGRAIVAMAPRLPEVAFLLMGGHCQTLENLTLPPNVFLLGIVSDAVKQTVLRSADLALAPLISGSGTNLKVVEYLAAGIPLVSTPVGMRGLNFDPGLVRVADLADFPAAIRTELQAADTAPARTARARTLVEASYGWQALGQVATAAIEKALDLLPRSAGVGGSRRPRSGGQPLASSR